MIRATIEFVAMGALFAVLYAAWFFVEALS
jgi:hypothetical protein